MHWFLIGYPVLVATVAAVFLVQHFLCLNSSEWASWVQAIGSIAAIAGAIYAVLIQHTLDVKRQEEAANAEAYRLVSLSVDFTQEAWQFVIEMLAFRSNPSNTENGWDRIQQTMRLQEIQDAILVIPAERLPTVEATRQVGAVRRQIERALALVEHGPVRDDVRMRCGELYGERLLPVEEALRRAHESLREEAYALMPVGA